MRFRTLIYRRMCAKSDAKRDKGLTIPQEIRVFCDLPYGECKKYHLLDVYRPKDSAGRLPVIVNFHGGAWVYGSKEVYQFYCASLAQQGFAVVNPNYRLAPKHKYPAAIEDISRVFAFVMQNAEQYGFDTERIFGIGDSSGATGMAVTALLLTNPAYAAKIAVQMPAGVRLYGIALNCPVLSMEGKRRGMQAMLPKGREEETLRLLHIPAHITADFPPCSLMTAQGDFCRSEPQALIPALEQHGVPYQYKVWGDEQNPLGHVFHCNVRSAAAIQANKEQMQFFRSLL